MHFRPQQPVDVFFSYKGYRAQAQAQLKLGGKDAVEMIEDPVDAPTTSPTNEHTKRYHQLCLSSQLNMQHHCHNQQLHTGVRAILVVLGGQWIIATPAGTAFTHQSPKTVWYGS